MILKVQNGLWQLVRYLLIPQIRHAIPQQGGYSL